MSRLQRNSLVSGATFTRDTLTGGWPLFESIASFLPLVDEMLVVDMGSTDGTLEILEDLAKANPRIRVEHGDAFDKNAGDARAFAVAANDCMARADHDRILFFQADEVPHHGLLQTLSDRWNSDLPDREKYDLAFWRLQVCYNFQQILWLPHDVHRVVWRGWQDSTGRRTTFDGDGRTTQRTADARILNLDHDRSWFPKWGELWGEEWGGQKRIPPPDRSSMPFYEFLFDCTKEFQGNIRERRRMHAPFWREPDTMMDGLRESVDGFLARTDINWSAKTSPFDLPMILRGLVGTDRYHARPEVLDSIARDQCEKVCLP